MNAYLKRHSGGDFTAKDFRTWNATVLAAVALSGDGAQDNGAKKGRAARERAVKQAIETVAAYLGNTPAVCRASYVDPRVIDRFQAGAVIAPASRGRDLDLSRRGTRARVERAVLDLLDGA